MTKIKQTKTTFTTEEIVQFLSGRFTEKAPLFYVIREIEKGGIVNWYENNGKLIYNEKDN